MRRVGALGGVDDEGGDGGPEAKGMGARGGVYGEGGMALLLRRAGWSRCCWEVGGWWWVDVMRLPVCPDRPF